MNEPQFVTEKSARDLFTDARLSIGNKQSMIEGAGATQRAVEALKSFGFTTDKNVNNVEHAAVILDEIGAFVDKIASQIPQTLPGKMSAEQAAQLVKQLQLQFEVVEVFKNAVEGLGATVSNNFATKVDDHTFVYRVAGPPTPQSQESYIRGKLGDNAQGLIDKLKQVGLDIALNAPAQNSATLRANSNRLEQIKQDGSNDLIDPAQGTNLVIEAVCIAQKSGVDLKTIKDAKSGEYESRDAKGARIKELALEKGLEEGTASILEKLTSGSIEVSGNAAFGVLDSGSLSVGTFGVYTLHINPWAPVFNAN